VCNLGEELDCGAARLAMRDCKMRSCKCDMGAVAMHGVSFRTSACQVAVRLELGQAREMGLGAQRRAVERQPGPLAQSVADTSVSMRSPSKRPNGVGGAAENNGAKPGTACR
jgi:hypothetical protein